MGHKYEKLSSDELTAKKNSKEPILWVSAALMILLLIVLLVFIVVGIDTQWAVLSFIVFIVSVANFADKLKCYNSMNKVLKSRELHRT